jgi:hypothetical protein
MFLVASTAASGCSDDETTTTGTGTTTRSTTTGTTTTGTTTTTSTTSGGGNGAGGNGVGGGAGGGSQAQAFCMDYETPCGFGTAGRYESLNACVAAFEGATAECQACWVSHLANAGSDPDSIHCQHACGSGQGVPAACSACEDQCM